MYHSFDHKTIAGDNGNSNHLRVCLKEDKEKVAEDGEGGDDDHEDETAATLDAVALDTCTDAGYLDDGVSDEKDGAVHFPLALGIRECIQFEEWDARWQHE